MQDIPDDPHRVLLRRYLEEGPVVRAYVRACLRSHSDCDDVVQEIWAAVSAKAQEYDAMRSFRAWLLGIARVQVLRWRQAKARSREVLAPDVIAALADTAVEMAEELSQREVHLRDCLRELPEGGRQVLALKYADGWGHAAIAARLGRTVAAVDMGFVRLRRALRACIEGKLRAASEEVT